jgi:hypothetical protein
MGTIAESYMLRIRLSEALAELSSDCAYCNEILEVGNIVFLEVQSMRMYHLKTCRREAVKKAAEYHNFMPEDLVRTFLMDRPTAYRIVAEVRQNGNGY